MAQLSLLTIALASLAIVESVNKTTAQDALAATQEQYDKAVEKAKVEAAKIEAKVQSYARYTENSSLVDALADEMLKGANHTTPTREDVQNVEAFEKELKLKMRIMRKDAKRAARAAKHWARMVEKDSRKAGEHEHIYEKRWDHEEHWSEHLADHVENVGDKEEEEEKEEKEQKKEEEKEEQQKKEEEKEEKQKEEKEEEDDTKDAKDSDDKDTQDSDDKDTQDSDVKDTKPTEDKQKKAAPAPTPATAPASAPAMGPAPAPTPQSPFPWVLAQKPRDNRAAMMGALLVCVSLGSLVGVMVRTYTRRSGREKEEQSYFLLVA
jgi:hypothetical protein